MAPLKFRVWDKNGKWMSYGERENYDDMIAWRFAHWEPETDVEGLPDVVLMQSTGLHDKNGKEIFEGDICRADWHDARYEPMNAEVTWNQKETGFSFGVGLASEVGWSHEVIGNIYENPDLLTAAV